MVNPLQLVRFAAVAERLSFSDAASGLTVDQATLSRQIRQLERDLGFQVFHRTTRRVALTAEGEALLPAAKELSRTLDAARRTINSIASKTNVRLRFGMHPFVYWSPQVRAILQMLAAGRQSALVEASSGMSERNLRRIRAHTLDAALVLADSPVRALETVPAMSVTPHVVVPEEHDAAGCAALARSDIARLQIAIFRPGRDHYDFDQVYGPIFACGAKPVTVSEGAAAVVFHASADRLAMISLRDIGTPPPDGFVRVPIAQTRQIDFILARLPSDSRGLVNQFWDCARRLAQRAAISP